MILSNSNNKFEVQMPRRYKPQNKLKGYKATFLDYSSESKAIDGTKQGTRYSKIRRWERTVHVHKRAVRQEEKDSLTHSICVWKAPSLQ